MTVFRREGGLWSGNELGLLATRVTKRIAQQLSHPEYLILLGHYNAEEVLKVMGGGMLFDAIQVTGVQSEELPFVPNFF